jgi:heptosyltransferase-2
VEAGKIRNPKAEIRSRQSAGLRVNAPRAIPSAPPRRLLVRGVNWLGDAVMTTPALLRLRERFPRAHLALLTPAKLRDLWSGHPAVNETISFEPGDGLISVGRKLQAGNFDLALVLPNSPRSALEVWLAGIPRRVGYARPWRNWFLTQPIAARPGHAPMRKRSVAEIQRLIVSPDAAVPPAARRPPPERAHHIHEYLHLAVALGASPEPLPPRLFVTSEEIAAAQTKFGLAPIRHPVVGLSAGAEYGPAKRWPLERFVETAGLVQRRVPCRWLILGGPAEAALAAQVAAGIRYQIERPPTPGALPADQAVLNLAGRTSLRELLALLTVCRVLLTNDSGPMHVAAALGTPVVALFGSTSPALTGPGLPGDPRHRLLQSDAPCAPCFRRECPIDFRCLKGVSVETVVEAVSSALAGPGFSSAGESDRP